MQAKSDVSWGRHFWPASATPTRPTAFEAGLAVVTAVFAFVVLRWVMQLWQLGSQARPVLQMFEAEAGRELSGIDWYHHEAARAVFCPHPGADPASSPIGRFIDGSPMYGPVVALQMAGVILGSGLLSSFAVLSGGGRGVRRVCAITCGCVFVATLLPLIAHHDVIAILTEVTE